MNQSSAVPAQSAWANGPPKTPSAASSPCSQSPWSNNLTSATSTILSWRPSATCKGIPVKGVVSGSRSITGTVTSDVASSPTGSTDSHLSGSPWGSLGYKSFLDLSPKGPSTPADKTFASALSTPSKPTKTDTPNSWKHSSDTFQYATSDEASSPPTRLPNPFISRRHPAQQWPSAELPQAHSYPTFVPSSPRLESGPAWDIPESPTFARQKPLSDSSGSQLSDAGWPPILSSPRLVRDAHIHLDQSSDICTSPPLTPQLNPNASAFVPGRSRKVVIRSVDGAEVELDMLKKRGLEGRIGSEAMAMEPVCGKQAEKAYEKAATLQEERIGKEEEVRAWTHKEAKGEGLQQEEEQMKIEVEWRRSVDDWNQATKEWEATITGPDAATSSWDTFEEKLQTAASFSAAPFRVNPIDKSRPRRDLRPRSLARVPIVKDINQVAYPEGIKGPDRGLNTYAKDSKFIYDREFLIQFMSVCEVNFATSPVNISPSPSDQPFIMSRRGRPGRYSLRISRRSYGG